MSRYLLDDKFISYYPGLARRIGVHAAILAQAIYSLQDPEKSFGRDVNGIRWIFNTYSQWADLTGLTVKQVEHATRSLEALGVVVSFISDDPQDNRLKFYRVDPEHAVFRCRETSPVEGRRSPQAGDPSPVEGRLPITTNPNNSSPTTSPEEKPLTKIQLREQQLLPLAKSCIEVVAKAKEDRGLVQTKQNEAKAVKTIRLAIDSDGIPEADILPLCQWMFNPSNRDFEWNLQNLSTVHGWRKEWTSGIALVVRHTRWKTTNGQQQSEPEESYGPPVDRSRRQGDPEARAKWEAEQRAKQ